MGTINPLGKDLFVDLKVDFNDMDLSPLTPYANKYIGHNIQKGKLSLDLKYLIEKLAIDRLDNVNFKLPAILIAGKEGKQLLARALSHSMCNSFEQVQGKHLNMGGYSGSLYKNSDSETVYYISSADRLSPYSASLLHNFLTHGQIK